MILSFLLTLNKKCDSIETEKERKVTNKVNNGELFYKSFEYF